MSPRGGLLVHTLRSAFFLGTIVGFGLLGSACQDDTDSPVDEAPAPLCAADQTTPGKSPMRRLTRYEYNNTVRDLLGDTTEPASSFPAEEEALGFDNNALALNVTPILVEKYMTVAETVARNATVDAEARTGCKADDNAFVRDACMKSFIGSFGRRALRRPLTSEEIGGYFDLFSSAFVLYAEDPEVAPFREGVEMVLEAMLQSPDFLYRVELGEGLTPFVQNDEVLLPLNSYEMATRLSYFLWGTTPDDELLDLAEANGLVTREQVETVARQMLESPRAHDAVARFHQEWLDYDRINSVTKDPTMFPEWSPAIGALMQEELRTFIDHMVFDPGASFDQMLTADYSYADHDLAAFYGQGVQGDAFQRISFPPNQHAGLLSMGAILAYYAHTNQTSPVHRGKLVRELFLCDTIAPPPNNISFKVPEPSPDATTRERFAIHSQDAACAGCHSLMDPLGFGFESFDALGRFRSEENGMPVDDSGKITGSDVDGEFVGLEGLTQKLVQSDEVKACYTKMWFRYTYGRGETVDDQCTLDRINDSFDKSDGDIKELLITLTQTDAFLFRRALTPAGRGAR